MTKPKTKSKSEKPKQAKPAKPVTSPSVADADGWFRDGERACEFAWPDVSEATRTSPHEKGSVADDWWTRGYAYMARLLARGAGTSDTAKQTDKVVDMLGKMFGVATGSSPSGKAATTSGPQTIVCPTCTGTLTAHFHLSQLSSDPLVTLACEGACKSGFTLPLDGLTVGKAGSGGAMQVPQAGPSAAPQLPDKPKPHRDPLVKVNLTAEEIDPIRDNRVQGFPACPDCKVGALVDGPSGGGSINVMCINGNCGSQFNNTGTGTWERITPPSPLR